MAFKLTKGELALKAILLKKLEETQERVEAAITDYNATVAAANAALLEVISDFNAALEDARTFAADVVSQAEQDISDRSEKWVESEKGEQAQEWINAWSNAGAVLDPFEPELPDELVYELPDWQDAFAVPDSYDEA